MIQKKVLIIEDERKIARGIQTYLEDAQFQVLKAYTGQTGLSYAQSERPDLIILDLNLPDRHGLDVCKTIRGDRRPMVANVPIIMLTANTTETDKLTGLGAGADDYVTKPFSPHELVARAQAIFRRLERLDNLKTILQDGDLVVDVEGHSATLKDQKLDLTPNEFAVLVALMRHQGMVLTRDQLIEEAFGHEYEGKGRTVDVYVRYLRRKIEQAGDEPSRITTVFGVGYKYEG
ncbi:MAG: response regulator transcription factor [Chloroflexota bacterium]